MTFFKPNHIFGLTHTLRSNVIIDNFGKRRVKGKLTKS